MPECQQPDRKGISIFGEQHPAAIWCRLQPISEARDIRERLIPSDTSIGVGFAIPAQGHPRRRVSILSKQLAEGAHPERFSETKLARLRTDWKMA